MLKVLPVKEILNAIVIPDSRTFVAIAKENTSKIH